MNEKRKVLPPTNRGKIRRADISLFISAYRGKNGYYPSVGEIAVGLNTMKSNIHHHLLKMEKEGTLKHTPGIARSWRLSDSD